MIRPHVPVLALSLVLFPLLTACTSTTAGGQVRLGEAPDLSPTNPLLRSDPAFTLPLPARWQTFGDGPAQWARGPLPNAPGLAASLHVYVAPPVPLAEANSSVLGLPADLAFSEVAAHATATVDWVDSQHHFTAVLDIPVETDQPIAVLSSTAAAAAASILQRMAISVGSTGPTALSQGPTRLVLPGATLPLPTGWMALTPGSAYGQIPGEPPLEAHLILGCEAFRSGQPSSAPQVLPADVQSDTMPFQGTTAVLQTGTGKAGRPMAQMRWHHGAVECAASLEAPVPPGTSPAAVFTAERTFLAGTLAAMSMETPE